MAAATREADSGNTGTAEKSAVNAASDSLVNDKNSSSA